MAKAGESRSVYIPDDLWAQVTALAEAENRSASWAACELMRRGMRVAKVPIVAGDLEDWQALAEFHRRLDETITAGGASGTSGTAESEAGG